MKVDEDDDDDVDDDDYLHKVDNDAEKDAAIEDLSAQVKSLSVAVKSLTEIVQGLQHKIHDEDSFCEKTVFSHASHSPVSKYGGQPSVPGKQHQNKPYGEICLQHNPETGETIWADVFKTDRDAVYYIERGGEGGRKYITNNAKKLKQIVLNPDF